MKPILFNPNMVRAILNGRKTVTRRVVKPPALYAIAEDTDGNCVGSYYEDEHGAYMYPTTDDCPYCIGDILYVREEWQFMGSVSNNSRIADRYIYRATWSGIEQPLAWRPSIHMPKEAARIFLRVMNVRVERLQDISNEDLLRDFGFCLDAVKAVGRDALTRPFWDKTIKPADRALYAWNANPWVWVIEFERE